jgi:LysR family hca operon transcriptional activator
MNSMLSRDLELRHLRYFVAVAEELNITRAAERLHTAQPSLGRQIRRLEEAVGAVLLRRQGRRFTLTKAGQVLLEKTRAVLHDLDSVCDHVQHTSEMELGQLAVGFIPGTEWRVFPRLAPFLNDGHSGVHVVLRSLTVPEQIEALQNQSIDVAFLRGEITDPEITSEVVLADRIIAILPAKHRLAAMKRVRIADLACLPLVFLKRSIASELYDAAMALAAAAGVEFRSRVETENILTSLSAVGVGLGCALVPEYLEQMLPATAVSRPLDHRPTPRVNLVMAYRKNSRQPMLGHFLSLVRDCFRTEAAGQPRKAV